MEIFKKNVNTRVIKHVFKNNDLDVETYLIFLIREKYCQINVNHWKDCLKKIIFLNTVNTGNNSHKNIY